LVTVIGGELNPQLACGRVQVERMRMCVHTKSLLLEMVSDLGKVFGDYDNIRI